MNKQQQTQNNERTRIEQTTENDTKGANQKKRRYRMDTHMLQQTHPHLYTARQLTLSTQLRRYQLQKTSSKKLPSRESEGGLFAVPQRQTSLTTNLPLQLKNAIEKGFGGGRTT